MTSLSQVQSFQTSDGKLHTDKVAALTHQAQIDLRGMIQSRTVMGGPAAQMTPTQFAEFVISRSEDVAKLLKEYREKMRRAAQK